MDADDVVAGMEVFICIYIDMNAFLAGDVADEGGVQTCAAVEDDIAFFRDGDFACVQIFSVDNGIFFYVDDYDIMLGDRELASLVMEDVADMDGKSLKAYLLQKSGFRLAR